MIHSSSPQYRCSLRPLALLFLLWLSACATGPVVPVADAPWLQRSAQLAALQHWDASGKLALRSADQAESANLSWQQRGQHTVLLLSGPLGLQATEIRSDGRELELRQGDEIRQFDISSPEAIQALTGWDLPLQALPWWLKGVPAPEPRATRMEVDDNLLRVLQQDGWLVIYERYQAFGPHILPTRLTIERGSTRVRLLIQHWQAGSAA